MGDDGNDRILEALKIGHNHLRILWNCARNEGLPLGHDYKRVLNQMKKAIDELENRSVRKIL